MLHFCTIAWTSVRTSGQAQLSPHYAEYDPHVRFLSCKSCVHESKAVLVLLTPSVLNAFLFRADCILLTCQSSTSAKLP